MALAKLGQLELLSQLFGQVHLPTAVYREVGIRGKQRGYPDAQQVQMAIHRQQLRVVGVAVTDLPSDITTLSLDPGEKEAIYLAQSEADSLVLLDDWKVREEAKARGLKARGTLGVIVQGYRANLINFDEVEALFEGIISHDQIWIAEGLCRQVLGRLQVERQSP